MSKVFLYHVDCEQGNIFDLHEANDMMADGWVDTPSKLNLPEKKPELTVTMEQAKKATPDQVIGMIKNLGFLVMTPDEFEAELNKRLYSGKQDKQPDPVIEQIEEYQEVFNAQPEELTKDELVFLGNARYKLGLRSNMKEATLIEKIKVAMGA